DTSLKFANTHIATISVPSGKLPVRIGSVPISENQWLKTLNRLCDTESTEELQRARGLLSYFFVCLCRCCVLASRYALLKRARFPGIVQSSRYSAHGRDDFLASRWSPHVGPGVHGNALRKIAGVF